MNWMGVSIISTYSDPPPINYIHSQVPEGIHKGVVALWPLEIVAGAETLYICMKKTCYEYEGNGGSQS